MKDFANKFVSVLSDEEFEEIRLAVSERKRRMDHDRFEKNMKEGKLVKLSEMEKAALDRGNKLDAIMLYYRRNECTLTEAKSFIEKCME